VARLGELGVVLLMFFVGMEMCLHCLIAKWRIVIIGTLLQIAGSLAVVGLIGLYFDWSLNRVIFLGFIISLSSTSVVIKFLEDRNELDTEVGQSVVGVLLAQDVAVIPMILILQFLGHASLSGVVMLKQTMGFLVFLSSIVWVSRQREKVGFPFARLLFNDPEFQVFIALLLCFGSAMMFSLLDLSPAMGAFAGGIAVAALKNTEWVHHHLSPFRVVFISMFFVSVGMQLDIVFLMENWVQVALLVLGVLATNTLLNGLVFRGLGMSWRRSMYAGALLSQIGEFSFVLAAIGHRQGLITDYGFNLAMSTIVVSLILTVVWVRPVARWTFDAGDGRGHAFPVLR
jgi:CPA2 family monovalent cation:H+ antiporter-2